ncbi:MAG: hypothetical protein C0490_18465 [Marivirga sp.]|nr:hypothetical protein [Marivirga sp.]
MQAALNLEQDKIKATGDNQVASESTTKNPNDNPIPKKWQRVLKALLIGKSYNRFEAERLLNDHCLHSTVSTLQSFGVTIFRETETVKGWQGLPTRVRRYWIDKSPENTKRANELLNLTSDEGEI